jgi:drug/metabolite transporter (DMT)-like permease
MYHLILYILIIGAGTLGELCVTRAMKVVGEVKDFRPIAVLRVFARAVQVPWMWAGVALMATAFFSLLTVLTTQNVSLVVPVTALNYGAGALGGRLILGETVSLRRWIGVWVVCMGVAVVILGGR